MRYFAVNNMFIRNIIPPIHDNNNTTNNISNVYFIKSYFIYYGRNSFAYCLQLSLKVVDHMLKLGW